MNYDEIIAEYEKGVDWQNMQDAPDKLVLETRLIAMRRLEAMHEQEAQRLHRESEQIEDVLMAM